MPTLAQAQATLSARVGILAKAAGVPVDATVPAGAYMEAIAFGLSAAGVFAADPTNPTDLEVQSLPAATVQTRNPWYFFTDVAEFRLLEVIAPAFAVQVSLLELPDVKKQKATTALLTYLESKRKALMQTWGYGVPTLGFGSAVPRSVGVEGHVFDV